MFSNFGKTSSRRGTGVISEELVVSQQESVELVPVVTPESPPGKDLSSVFAPDPIPTTIASVRGPFVVKDFFTAPPDDLPIGSVSPAFKRLFFSVEEQGISSTELITNTIRCEVSTTDLVSLVGDPKRIGVRICHIAEFLRVQGKQPIRTNLFVVCINNNQYYVTATWYDGKLHFDGGELTTKTHWLPGVQVTHKKV